MKHRSVLGTGPEVGRRPDIQRANFDDPDLFSAALQKVNLQVTQTGRGPFKASLTRFTTGSCDVQTGSINRQFAASGPTQKDRTGFLMELQGGRNWSCFGQTMDDQSVAVCSGGHELLLKAEPATQWAFISVAPDALEDCARKVYGREPRFPKREMTIAKADGSQLARIRALFAQFLAESKIGPVSPWGSLPSIEQVLLRSMVEVLAGATRGVPPRAISSFQRVLSRVQNFLAANLTTTTSLERLSAAVGVDQESLEQMFQEHLGVGPIQYLEIHRLSQVHRALLMADPRTTRVADVARAWGFTHLDIFASEFTAFFKQTPSEVLRRPNNEYRGFILTSSDWR